MTTISNPRFVRFVDEKGTLTNQGQADVAHGLSVLRHAVALNNFEKGWRTPDAEPRQFTEMTSLLHSEVTEAFEACRNRDPVLWYELGKPMGVASELADVIIRVLDWADEHDLPLIEAVLQKHAYNQTRAYKHGGKLC